jgi:AcrR family transcriptional regulator
MNTSIRVCRQEVEAELGRPEMNRRQREREKRILEAGEMLMARHGRHGITFRTLAGALRIARTTLAWHFTDLDALLGDILRTYLQTLHTILGAVPVNAPNRQADLRAAYLKAIQGPFGGLTPAHTLLTRDRHLLPPDELDSIEQTLKGLSELLAGDLGPIALSLLEHPCISPEMAEACLATAAAMPPITTTPITTQDQPEPEPAITAPEPPAPQPAPSTRYRHFDLKDLPLPLPGSLAAMTDDELDALEQAALLPPAPHAKISDRPRFPLAANIAALITRSASLPNAR